MSVHGTSTLCRQLVAKLSGITEWYKSGTTRSQNPYAAGFTDQKLYVRQIGVNGIMVGYCVLLKFQFACKSRLWNVAHSTSYCTKTHHLGWKFRKCSPQTPPPPGGERDTPPHTLPPQRLAFPHLFFYKLTNANMIHIAHEIKRSLPRFTGYSFAKFHWNPSITFSAMRLAILHTCPDPT